MDFNKNLWISSLWIYTMLLMVHGLNQQKLKYILAETEFPDIERLPNIDDSTIDQVVNIAKRSVENEARINADTHFRKERSHFSHRKVKAEVWPIHKDAEIGARAVNILSSTHNLTRDVSEHFVKRAPPRTGINFNVLCQNRRIQCDRSAKFRTLDGSCNNLINTSWGMAVSTLKRLLNPKYGDGVNSPRISTTGRQLPLARFVSTTTIPDIDNEDERLSHMMVQFGQFMNHDVTSTPDRTDLTNCCANQNTVDCFPLMIPNDDPQLSRFQIGCMEFARSIRACGNGVRQQINQNTAFIDGSQVYGSSTTENNGLRTLTQGLLQSTNRGQNLPIDPDNQACSTRASGTNLCFKAGDGRLNIQPGLSSVHTLFMREHNRIARILRSMLPRLNDETLFQETRRVVIAQLENIVYNEFLPIVLGSQLMTQFDLNLPKDGRATSYKSDVDPSIFNSFSTAAFRFGHSQIQNFGQLGTSGNRFALKDNFNNPTVVHRFGADSVLVGSVAQNAQGMENFMVEAVTRFLFKEGNNPVGLDLAAFNIQRGRDHGLPSYNDFRQLCELPRISSFDELRNVFSDSRAPGAFREAYQNVDDIDLFPAGIAETRVPGGLVGPTFACIIGIQFHRLLYGDRHFFTHENQPGSFTPDERALLSKRTLSSIMCDNLDVNSVQLNAFMVASDSNPLVACNQHPKIDFNVFM